MGCLAPLVCSRSNSHGVFFILHRMLANCLLFTHHFWNNYFPFQICQTQSLYSKYCDLVLQKIISFYCFRRVVEKFQVGIVKESTNKIFWEHGRQSFCPQNGKYFGKKTANKQCVCARARTSALPFLRKVDTEMMIQTDFFLLEWRGF